MTVTTNINKGEKERFVSIGETTGTVGHAILKYKSGGLLLASAGHWIELKNMGKVSDQKIEEVAKQFSEKGNQEYMQSYLDLENYTGSEKEQKKQVLVSRMVQKTAPNKYKKLNKF